MYKLETQIKQIANGDLEAMEPVYNRTKAAVYGLALSIVRNSQDAEDIMQETYIRVYEAATTYRPQGSRWHGFSGLPEISHSIVLESS